ncbi:MAG: ImmA/IrrE family metallo-endopeptidase [Lachnotalea sp.]
MDSIELLIEKHNTRNPFKIAENLHIIVIYEKLGTIHGYYNTAYRQKFIHINESLAEHEQYFTAAHELGHALLHPKANTPFLRKNTLFSINKLEKEANNFAINLLISDEDILSSNCTTTEQLSSFFGYHENLMVLKIEKMSNKT